MNASDSGIVKGNPADAERIRKFEDGSVRSSVPLRSASIGLGRYEPGWRWSLHAGAQTGRESENHIGYVISGTMVVQDSHGHEVEVGPGEAFEAGPGHDAWVTGTEACVALDFFPSK